MIDKRVESVEAALADIEDGASVMISGFGGAGTPANLMRGLDATGAKDLTVIVNSLRFLEGQAPGLFADKRVKQAVCTAARGRGKTPSDYELQWQAGELDIDMCPQGTFAERIRAGGAGIPAFFTPTAAGVELGEGKEVRMFDGRPSVLETALRADFSFMRGAEADRFGNVRFRGSQANFGMAMAPASDVAIVEVQAFSDTPLRPEDIDLPGVYVERIVLVPDVGEILG
jgi:3-oxoacid CoA-transferase A subunit